MRAWLTILSLIIPTTLVAAEPAPICSLDELVCMSECQLLELYKNAEPGPMPNGFTPGRTIPNPGTHSTVRRSKMMTHVWQGKIFGCDGIMTNRFFGLKMIKGQMTQECSWLDGRPVNAIDYHHTSLVFKPYRDEFREVAPGIYLGMMWKRDDCQPKMLTWFALDARTDCCVRCGNK